MKTKLRKVLKVMLPVLLVVLMFNINVSAAPRGQASIGKKNYTTVEKALAAVKNGQTIKLNKDITLKKPLYFKKNAKYTFDMNKHKFKSTLGRNETVGGFDVQAGNVTFMNGTASTSLFVHEKATVAVKSGTYEQVTNWGKTTIQNGKIQHKKYSAICNYKGKLVINNVTARANYNCVYANAGTVTINGGNYKSINSKTSYPLIFSEKATIYLKGGKYTATNGPAVYNEHGKIVISKGSYGGNIGMNRGLICNCNSMTIKGGTFVNSDESALFCGPNSNTVVSGGKFTVKNGHAIDVVYNKKKLLINGGTFEAYTVVLCESDDRNIIMDRKKVKLIGFTGGIAIH